MSNKDSECSQLFSYTHHIFVFIVKSECKPESFTVGSILCNDMHRSMLKEGQVKKMPGCSLITSYQFQSNGRMRHILLTSNSNSMVLTEYNGYTEAKVRV